MAAPRKHPDEVRDKAVRLVHEWRRERNRIDGGLKEIGAQLGIHPETLRNWLRQSEIDAVRQVAELASEVEELIANETDPALLVREIRSWVKRSGLEPIGRAGEETRFDRKVHRPVGGSVRDGATVIVVRPGYIWRAAAEDVLIGKAVVEE